VTPSFSLTTQERRNAQDPSAAPLSLPSVKLSFNAAATYREYFGGNASFREQRNVGVNADARIDILPQRPWTFSLLAGYVRTIRPTPSTSAGDPNFLFTTSNPYAGAQLSWTPNNGTFNARLGYTVSGILFEQSAGAPFSSLRHEFVLSNNWQFRPRTSLFHESTLGVVSYLNPERAVNQLTDSIPLRSRIGFNGLITDRIGALAAVGYGGSFFSTSKPSAQQFDSLIGQAELRWFIAQPGPVESEPGKLTSTSSTLFAGFLRDFETSYLGFSMMFGAKLLTTINGGVAAVTYPNIFLSNGKSVNSGFTVIRPDVQLFAEYRFTPIFAVNATFAYSQRISDAIIDYGSTPGATGANGNNRFGVDSQRIEAFGGARLMF
jgi:hypothetical protein